MYLTLETLNLNKFWEKIMNLNELFELNHDLVNVLHNYADLDQPELNDEDYEVELEKFIKTDLVKKFFNYGHSHDAMHLRDLYTISEFCVEDESEELKHELRKWTSENEIFLTAETKSLFSQL